MTPSDDTDRSAGASGPWAGAVDRLGPVVATFCALVVLAAGGSAVALLTAPGSTDRYFSWTLRPRAAAAMIGGLYLASSGLFAWSLTLPWRQVRPLFVGVLGLTTPTFVLTVVHDEVFDFGRWQAVVWVVLFAGAPLSAVAILATSRREPARGPRLRTGARAVLGALALVAGALAVTLWSEDGRRELGPASPVDLVGLTGGYLGAWCSFAAALAGWAAWQARWDDVRLPLVAIAAVAGGLTIALLRVLGDLRHPVATLAAVVALGVVAVVLHARAAPPAEQAVLR